MKKIVLLLLVLNYVIGAFAHIEPTKTVKEKKENEEKRKTILKNKIQSYIVWNHEINDHKINFNSKEKNVKFVFDKNGNNTELIIFKKNGEISIKKVLVFDENNNMESNMEYSSDLSLTRKANYYYGTQNKVVSQINYNHNSEIESKFIYVPNTNENIITFTKLNTSDSIEYQIIYKYDENENNIGVTKQYTSGEIILRVQNIFNINNQRTKKKIFDTDNELLFYFEYTYFENSNKFASITKKSSEGKTISKSLYKLNGFGMLESITETDANDNIISHSTYQYII